MGRQQWNDKRQAFLDEYLINGFNATKAAETVGYAEGNKYGPFLVNLGIFRKKLAERLVGRAMKADEILFRLTRVGRLGIANFFKLNAERDGLVVDWEAVATSPDRDVLQKLRIGADGSVTIEGGDRLRALELLGKAYGMFAERVINEQAEQAPLSNAVLEQAMEDLRAYEDESQRVIKDWRDRMAKAGGPQAPTEQG
jgi:hypothetical protein